MKKQIFFVVLLLGSLPLTFAEELVMSVDQSEYYFLVGENAVIPLEIQNDYGHQISGMLQYTISQQILQGNMQFSSSNTQSSTFIIDDGHQNGSLNFGTSDSPTTLTVTLNFNYNDGNDMHVSFEPIIIHFVSDESQKNNIQNKMQRSSQQDSSNQNTQSQSQQSLQQKLDELMNQSPLMQDPQQRLQNNQMAQDSSALKQEIQEQLQEETQLKKEFESQLASNEDFQKTHQQLLQQGYNVTTGSLDPSSASTGSFEVNYENGQGKWAKVKGNMVNGTMTEIQKQTQEEREQLLSILRDNPTFQEYENQLTQNGFVEQDMEFLSDKNRTTISLNYQDQEIQTATITADFENDNLEKIHLEKPSEDYSYLYSLLVFIPIVVVAYVLYKKLKTTKKILPKPIVKITSTKFDHVLESTNLIKEARNNFKEKQFKDAYSKVSRALRIFLSYELNLNKEITHEELLSYLDNTKIPMDEIKNCFKLSSLVEFAKHQENEDEFNHMIDVAENLINKKINNSKIILAK
ncbi:hypothetical protein NKOR_04500 [Candidatus Nitrosopumilus koreensis AR1]|uniref:Protein BatD n=1 Tax=Candidatus Nitrosopumilus koreensis AR1 TaxID=1229908 RepID=K0B3W3_9ARCH|nr:MULTISPECIES: hypothetical protein [Nitrosopumilus]AFS80788.1 hypothetical protein NKOR_04500 [Candidatus Nitrosopumilus koreensis AR1]